jgi:hypothetical protein
VHRGKFVENVEKTACGAAALWARFLFDFSLVPPSISVFHSKEQEITADIVEYRIPVR